MEISICVCALCLTIIIVVNKLCGVIDSMDMRANMPLDLEDKPFQNWREQ